MGQMKKSQEKSETILNWMKKKPTIYQNLWDTAKVVLKGQFMSVKGFISKEENILNSNIRFYLKKLEKKDN